MDSKAHSSTTSGRVPNLYFGCPLKESLRANSFDQLVRGRLYHGLPAADKVFGTSVERCDEEDQVVEINSVLIEQTCLIRQESILWAELHNYALTSGSISNLLGVWEPKAASRLGLSRRSSGHRQLASTCSKIIKNLGTSLDFFYERSLRLQRKLFEERGSCYDIRIDFDKKRNVCRKVEKACKAVANTGVTGVNMSWGSVQENTALLNYLAAIEDNQKLCEVGLCLLRPCDLPPELKGSDSFLPLLGAR